LSKVLLQKNFLKGRIRVPTSKSDLHRAIICAMLSNGVSTIHPFDLSDDVFATIEAARSLGATVSIEKGKLTIDTSTMQSPNVPYDFRISCGESGSTLRFLIPVISALGYRSRFEGYGRLCYRPLDEYFELLPQSGVTIIKKDHVSLPFYLSGKLLPGEFRIRGDISSQFISGLLMALPLLNDSSKIILTTNLESARYVDMTLKTMSAFGVFAEQTDYGFFVPGGQTYKICDYTVESDWSQAAFFMAAGAINGDLIIEGLTKDSTQGDCKAYDIMKQFGANLEWQEDGSLRAVKSSLTGIDIDATHVPDLVPIFSVMGACAKGKTVISGASRLRLKESDRLKALRECLTKIGVKVTEQESGLIITGAGGFHGSRVKSFNDHRIVMSMAIASVALHPKNSIEITDSQAVNKSYPTFFEHFASVGGIANVI